MRDSLSGKSSSFPPYSPLRFDSSIANGLRFYQIEKNCRSQVCIGKHLVAIASVQDAQGDNAALVLEFELMNGNIKRCLIRREDLVSRGGEKIFASLLARGYHYDLEHQASILVYLSGLGVGLPEIIADEFGRIGMDLEKLVSPVADTDDIDWIPF